MIFLMEMRRTRKAQPRDRSMRVFTLVACLAAILACGTSNAPIQSSTGTGTPSTGQAPTNEKTRRPRIVVLGDSLTAGLGLSLDQAYPAVLQRYLDEHGYLMEVVNAGVSGDTSAGGRRRLAWALDGDVRILIVALGANDGLRGVPVEEMTRNLESIIEQAESREIAVLLAGMEAPPNFGPTYTASFRRVFQTLGQRDHITFVPFLLTGVAGVTSLNQADGIHPTADGARMIADLLWPALKPMVEQTVPHD